MSGIEAAGIALGVFPIILSALEKYRESAEVVGDWWKFKRKYVKCKRDVEYLQFCLSSNLEQLLLPLVCDDDQIEALMKDPGGAGWEEQELDSGLRERLPNAYEAYLDSINEINHVLKKLKQELGLDKDYLDETMRLKMDDEKSNGQELQKLTTKQSFDYQFQRIKFALSQSNRDKLFQEFDKYNVRMRDLLKTADKVSAIRKDRKTKERSLAASVLKQFWRHASTVYKLLHRAFKCDCRSSHNLSLRLQHRTVPDIEFHVMFMFSMLVGHEGPWKWRDTKIKWVKPNKELKVQTPASPAPPLAPPNSTGSIRKSSIMRKFRKSATSDVHHSLSSSTTLVQTLSTSRSASSEVISSRTTSIRALSSRTTVAWQDAPESLEPPTPKEPEIADLCQTLNHNHPSEHKCLGVLNHNENCYALHPVNTPEGSLEISERVALKDILDKKAGINLTRRQRYSIAVAVASSQIQLQSTPWLQSKWDNAEIIFFRDKSKPDKILIDQPRLSRDITHNNETPPESPSNNDRSIITLGILLLELCFGATLESHPIRAKYPPVDGPQKAYIDLAAALEWNEQVNEEAGPEFANAINWCLKSNGSNTASDDLRFELYENVVKPLQECHQHLLGQ